MVIHMLPDGGRYALACAQAKVDILNTLAQLLDDVVTTGELTTSPLQDDWDDALQAANHKLTEARRLLADAMTILKEGV